MLFFRIICLLFLLLAINMVTVLLGDEQSQLNVVNNTEYYLHVFIESNDYLYLSPGKSITFTTNPKPEVIVNAIIAPGQGVKGGVTDTVSVPFRSASSGCTCEEDGTTDCSYTPPSGGSTKWEINSNMLEIE
jgi:hypothetical protein